VAVTLTTNLKLRIGSDLTADSRYNLQRLDSLGSIYQINTNQVANVRSQTDIILQPNDPDIGGSGTGGTVRLGTADQVLSELQVFASTVSISAALGLSDQATGGSQSLNLQYKSDINGAVDTSADRALRIDTDGADRDLVLGGDLSILSGSLALTLAADITWTLPNGNGTDGQVLTTDGSGTLTWTNSTAGALASLSDTNISSPVSGEVLTYDGADWINQAAAGGSSSSDTWANADGTTKTVTHGFSSRNVMVQVIDANNSYTNIEVDSITRPTDSSVVLTSSSAPTANWIVLLTKIS